MSPIIKSSILAVFIGLLTSCSKNIVEVRAERLPKKRDVVLMEVLDSLSGIEFDSFYTKMSTERLKTSLEKYCRFKNHFTKFDP